MCASKVLGPHGDRLASGDANFREIVNSVTAVVEEAVFFEVVNGEVECVEKVKLGT